MTPPRKSYRDSDAYQRSVRLDPVTQAPVFPLSFPDRLPDVPKRRGVQS